MKTDFLSKKNLVRGLHKVAKKRMQRKRLSGNGGKIPVYGRCRVHLGIHECHDFTPTSSQGVSMPLLPRTCPRGIPDRRKAKVRQLLP